MTCSKLKQFAKLYTVILRPTNLKFYHGLFHEYAKVYTNNKIACYILRHVCDIKLGQHLHVKTLKKIGDLPKKLGTLRIIQNILLPKLSTVMYVI